jgi:hypothetical protein
MLYVTVYFETFEALLLLELQSMPT